MNLIILNKKICQILNFAVPTDHKKKNIERKVFKLEEYLDLGKNINEGVGNFSNNHHTLGINIQMHEY